MKHPPLAVVVQATRRPFAMGCLALGGFTVGCKDLDQFDTRPGEAFCGSLVGQTTYPNGEARGISLGFEEPGWTGSDDRGVMSLTVTTGELYKDGGIPALLNTNDAAFGPCGPDRPMFAQAGLRTIGRALGDRISSLRLGDDHQADATTYVDSTCSGSMVAILSLIQNGTIELRLLRPAPSAQSDPAASHDPATEERFGLFSLRKHKDGCGF
jgi:hypothetical protein